MKSSVVLLSSGLDSTINFCKALRETNVKLALTFNYGQRAAEKEIDRAKKISARYQVPHQVIELPWLRDITKSSLVNTEMDVPTGAEVKINDLNRSMKTAEKVWVPNRNGVFLNIAASIAESLGAEYVVPGFNIEEAATFPDNSREFMASLDRSFFYSTANHVKVVCYTSGLNKQQIFAFGEELDAPFDLIWSCYFAGEEMCGQCESCQRYSAAVKS